MAEDTTVKGYVTNVTPTKNSRSKGFPFFNFTIQTESSTTTTAVCYDTSKQAEIKAYAESREPVKILNVGMKRNLFDPDKNDVVINKRSKIEPARNSDVTFEYNATPQSCAMKTEIGNIGSISENAIISVNGRLIFQIDSIEKIVVRQHEMQMMERCIITDTTNSIIQIL